MKKVKLTFVDVFSFCNEQKIIFVSDEQIKQIEKSINKIVHQEFKNNIKYVWELKSIQIIK